LKSQLDLLLNHISNIKVIEIMEEQPDIWKRKTSKRVADCRVFKVREDFCQSEKTGDGHSFFVIECPDWVNVIALTDQNQVVLIKQYRQGSEDIILELPGGMIDDGESPEKAARRELLEETGFSTEKEFVYLGRTRPNPAIQNNWMYHYLAIDCRVTQEISFDEHESIITKLFAFDEIPRLIETEQITHSLVVSAFYKMDKREENKHL